MLLLCAGIVAPGHDTGVATAQEGPAATSQVYRIMVWLQGAGDDLEQAVLAVAGKPAWGHAGPFLCVYPFVDHGLRGRCLIASLLLGPYTSLGTDWLPLCAAPALGGLSGPA